MFSFRLTVCITKTIRKIMRIMGKGATTLPGKVAIK